MSIRGSFGDLVKLSDRNMSSCLSFLYLLLRVHMFVCVMSADVVKSTMQRENCEVCGNELGFPFVSDVSDIILHLSQISI